MTPDESRQDEPAKPLPSGYAFVGMGTTAAVCVGVGVGLGILADSRAGTAPVFLFVGLLLGLLAAVVTVVAQVRRFL
jgi:F0F1-type ATP synthase assembly protein I